MYTTFTAASPAHVEQRHGANAQKKRNTQNDKESNHSTASPSVVAKPKRSQVARACEWCRLNRIKCDNDRPCHNCQNRGAECSNSGKAEVHSLPTANKYVPGVTLHIHYETNHFKGD